MSWPVRKTELLPLVRLQKRNPPDPSMLPPFNYFSTELLVLESIISYEPNAGTNVLCHDVSIHIVLLAFDWMITLWQCSVLCLSYFLIFFQETFELIWDTFYRIQSVQYDTNIKWTMIIKEFSFAQKGWSEIVAMILFSFSFLARVWGVPVGRRLGGLLVTTLVATINVIIFFLFFPFLRCLLFS